MSNQRKIKDEGVVTVRLGKELGEVVASLARRQGLSTELYLVKLAENDVRRFVTAPTT